MHITVVCPRCHTTFQLQPIMRGQRMRCPNASCKEIFTVPADAPTVGDTIVAPDKPTAIQKKPNFMSGHVGEFVPIIQGEAVEPPPDWRTQPPPSRRPEKPPASVPRTTKEAASVQTVVEPPALTPPPPTIVGPVDAPIDPTSGAWIPPPIRHPASPLLQKPAQAISAEPQTIDTASAKRHARRLMIIIPAFVAVLLFVVVGVFWYYIAETETRLAQQGQEQLEGNQFHGAADTYDLLLKHYPDSPRTLEYQFLRDLCRFQEEAGSLSDPQSALDRAVQLHEQHKDNPALKERGKSIGQAVVKLLTEVAQRAKEKPDQAAAGWLNQGDAALAKIELINRDSISPAEKSQITTEFRAARQAIKEAEEHRQFVKRMQDLTANPSIASVKKAHELIDWANAKGKGSWATEPDTQAALKRLYDGHLAHVSYLPQPPAVPPATSGEEADPSWHVAPLQGAHTPPTLSVNDQVVFSLARGVLSAHRQSNGEVLWCIRVGIDTAHLPIRLPPVPGRPESVLVQSADSRTLMALDVNNGARRWRYQLGAPCLGRPVLVDARAYVPTFDGKIHEIELSEGQLLGIYDFGPGVHFSVGGAREEGSKRLYFPADDYCVFVIDVGQKARPCDTILYSRHANGSLRSEPIVVKNGITGSGLDFLILNVADGLNASRLQVFNLPLSDQSRPLIMNPEPVVKGWPSFKPYCDGDTLALATDAGAVGLFGIREERNTDNPLFFLLPQESLTTNPAARAERALVVHAQEDRFWILSQGKLRKVLVTIDRTAGRKLVDLWSEPLTLGSPLQEGQVWRQSRLAPAAAGAAPFEEGEEVLLVVTQTGDGRACFATAVDARGGKIIWQRQLGMIAATTPLVFDKDVLAADSSGALFLYDSAAAISLAPEATSSAWVRSSGSVSKGIEDISRGPFLLRSGDGRIAYEIATIRNDTRLVARRYHAGTRSIDKEYETMLPQPLRGTPALTSVGLLLPLADGNLYRLPLPLGEGGLTVGPHWRARGADPESECYITSLGGDLFITNNGRDGLTRWSWPIDRPYRTVPPSDRPTTRELSDRVIGPPVSLKGGAALVVADVRGKLTLLEGALLEPAQSWNLGGTLTAGPFLRNDKIGCIVDRRRLVWIDPEKNGIAWQYESPGEAIVGLPQIIGDMIVVADQSGLFVGLDPATGKPRGAGYKLRASVAPAETPVPFSASRAFAPLTDGTTLLLSLDRLKK